MKWMACALVGACIFVVHAGALIPRVTFEKPETVVIRDWERWDLIVVKFAESTNIRLNGRQFTSNSIDLNALQRLLADYPDVPCERLFKRAVVVYENEKIAGELRTGRQLADLNLYYMFRPSCREEAGELLNDLLNLDIVETAYPEPKVEVASISKPGWLDTPDYVSQQDYLEESPIGIDAYAAWALEGGKGENVQFIDVELCWNWTHEDLPTPFFTAGTPDSGYIDHGTAVMGEVTGKENDYGITGISPLTPAGGVAIDIDDYPDSVGGWFDIASSALNPGDVWLIELHAPGPDSAYIPMEYWQANFDAIALSTAAGRICIEAGGNGSANLDNAIYEGRFNRTVRDSLAILVGAGTPMDMDPEWFTNYGSRIDANAWGSEIITTGYGDLYTGSGINQYYTADFGGTSGASPMVTGVACVAQSIYKELTNGEVLDPEILRAAITETGAPQPQPVTQYIGPRPDLEMLLIHEIFEVSGIHFNRSRYNCWDEITITVRDASAPAEVFVTVSSLTEPSGETFELPLIEAGKYQGTLLLTGNTPTPGDSILSVADGDIVHGEYSLLSSMDEADVDCQIPVITDVTIVQISYDSARISWTTDEPATSVVRYGTSSPDLLETDSALSTDHMIELALLTDCTDYYFQVESTDSAGNTATDDNGGSFYHFMTYELSVFMDEPLDSSPGWTISGGQWAFGQPTGQGGEHGSSDPVSGYTGSNVYGYNLNGDYGPNIPEYHLTTLAIDLSVAANSRLGFWRWLGVETSTYDHAYVRISTNGSTWTTIWQNSAEVADAQWTYCEYDISALADGQETVYIRWTMGNVDGYWQYCGWNIDDVRIFAAHPCDTTPVPTWTPPPTATTPTQTPTRTVTSTPTVPPSTPTPSPTRTQTATMIPSRTPTVSPTSIPSTPTPTSTESPPESTATPTSTAMEETPTQIPECTALGVTITMHSHEYHAGEMCGLSVDICNPLDSIDSVYLFVALEVYGQYWFYPSWRNLDAGLDYQRIEPLETGRGIIEIIPQFFWPETGSSAQGLRFYGLLTNPAISDIVGDWDTWEFSFSD